MAAHRPEVRIYTAFHTSDVMAYIESHADEKNVDVEATFTACEHGIRDALEIVYPEARIVVRREDPHAVNPAHTRVETDDPTLDSELIGQEVDDLISEFDIISCVVYRR